MLDWIVSGHVPVMLAFAGAVLAALGVGLTEVQRGREQARSEREAHERTNELKTKAEEIAELNRELAAKSDEIARLSKENLATVTGGDSFCYLSLSYADSAQGPILVLVHQGSFPLYDVAVRIADMDRWNALNNDLRRTYGRWMRIAAFPDEIIAPTMGHADTRMLERVYGKLTPEELSRRLLVHARATLPDCIANASVGTEIAGNPREAGHAGPANPSELVPRGGIEPPTRGFSVLAS
jgi:integrase